MYSESSYVHLEPDLSFNLCRFLVGLAQFVYKALSIHPIGIIKREYSRLETLDR